MYRKSGNNQENNLIKEKFQPRFPIIMTMIIVIIIIIMKYSSSANL